MFACYFWPVMALVVGALFYWATRSNPMPALTVNDLMKLVTGPDRDKPLAVGVTVNMGTRLANVEWVAVVNAIPNETNVALGMAVLLDGGKS